MPILRTKEKISVLYIHIPKCGGSSIEEWLRQYGAIALLDRDHQIYSKCSPQHFHSEILTRLFTVDHFDYVFTVVRNPYSRIISEYNMRMQFYPKEQQPFSDWLSDVLSQFKKNPWYLDNHLRPQSDFICFDCDVYRLEDGFDNLTAKLSLLLNKSVDPIPHVFKTKSTVNDIQKADRQLIEEIYAEDFSRFGYEIGGA